MELSFCDLRAKEVINVSDGRRLGNVIDLIFETCSACVTGIVVPGSRNFFNLFRGNCDIFIPFQRIIKIGKDVVLVEINSTVGCCSTGVEAAKTPEMTAGIMSDRKAAYSDLKFDNVGK